MIVPFIATIIERAMPAETIPAPKWPSTRVSASEAGRCEMAIALAGSTYCTAAFTRMYSAPTVATPKIKAIGILRSGRRISPATMFRSFQPSYAHSAATSAAKNPAMPPFDPEYEPPKFPQPPPL